MKYSHIFWKSCASRECSSNQITFYQLFLELRNLCLILRQYQFVFFLILKGTKSTQKRLHVAISASIRHHSKTGTLQSDLITHTNVYGRGGKCVQLNVYRKQLQRRCYRLQQFLANKAAEPSTFVTILQRCQSARWPPLPAIAPAPLRAAPLRDKRERFRPSSLLSSPLPTNKEHTFLSTHKEIGSPIRIIIIMIDGFIVHQIIQYSSTFKVASRVDWGHSFWRMICLIETRPSINVLGCSET